MVAVGVYGPRFYGSDLDAGVTTLIEGQNTFKRVQGDSGWQDPMGNNIPAGIVTADIPPSSFEPT